MLDSEMTVVTGNKCHFATDRLSRCAPHVALMTLIVALGGGCSEWRVPSWVHNGFADPSQVGNYRTATRTEIRSAMSILEEPDGIEGAEEPTPEDLLPNQVEPRIQPGDILRVSVFELQAPGIATEQQIQVRQTGMETFPTVGPVQVAGFTARELELELKRVLREKQVLEDADVQVTVLRSETSQFTVIGAVQAPGSFPITRPDLRLLTAIGSFGGLPTQVTKVYVFRQPESDSQVEFSDRSDSANVQQGYWNAPQYSLSDVGGGTGRGRHRQVRLAQAGELEKLESGPAHRSGAEPVFDPATGEWRMSEPDSVSRPATTMPATVPVTPNRPTTSQPGMQKAEGIDENGIPQGMRVIEIPASALLAGDPKYNIVIRPKDLIRVPLDNPGQYQIGGNVSNPGTYDLTGRQITVKQAIVSAGGFGPLAEPSRANLIRRLSNDEEQTIQVNLDAIFAGETPDFYLRPNDMINVGSAPYSFFLAVFRNAFRVSYGFGFVYDRNFADSDTFQARELTRQRELQERQLRGLPI